MLCLGYNQSTTAAKRLPSIIGNISREVSIRNIMWDSGIILWSLNLNNFKSL